MARGIQFEESSRNMGRPQGWAEDQCDSLPVLKTIDQDVHHPCYISCWQLSREELKHVNKMDGKLYIKVLGDILFPMSVYGFPFPEMGRKHEVAIPYQTKDFGNGNVVTYKDVIKYNLTLNTPSQKLTFWERLRILFGKKVFITGDMYIRDVIDYSIPTWNTVDVERFRFRKQQGGLELLPDEKQ